MLKRFLVDKAGNIFLNDVKRFGKGCIIVPASTNTPVITLQGALSSPILIEGPEEGVCEIFSLMGAHTSSDNAEVQAKLTVQITDMAYRRRLMNRPILANHVFGTSQRPFRLMETIILDSHQSLMFEFKNNVAASGSSNFRFALEALKLQRYGSGVAAANAFLADNKRRMSYLYPYWLTSDLTDTTITASTQPAVDIWFRNTSDQWLVLGKLMGTVYDNGAVAGNEAAERFAFDLFDAKSDRRLNNQPVSFNCGMGTVQFPYHLNPPIMVEPLSALRMRLYSLMTNSITTYITFAGVGCYAGAALFTPQMQNQPLNANAIPQGVM